MRPSQPPTQRSPEFDRASLRRPISRRPRCRGNWQRFKKRTEEIDDHAGAAFDESELAHRAIAELQQRCDAEANRLNEVIVALNALIERVAALEEDAVWLRRAR